jgi:hypothetical protein
VVGEFALDAAVAPGRILPRNAKHQVTDLLTDGRPRPDWFG